jgi:hypothetical protein
MCDVEVDCEGAIILVVGSGALRVRVRVPNDPPVDGAFGQVPALSVLEVLVKPASRTVVAAVSDSVTRNLAADESDTVRDEMIDDSEVRREHLLQRRDVVEINELKRRIMGAVFESEEGAMDGLCT